MLSHEQNLSNFLKMFCYNTILLAFCFAAPTVWNNLSEHVKSSASIDIFKERLKSELFACYSLLDCTTVSLNDSFELFCISLSVYYVTLNK